MHFKKICAFLAFLLYIGNVHALTITFPDSSTDNATILGTYIEPDLFDVTENYIFIRINDVVIPAQSSVYIKVLVPPGVDLVAANGEAGQFNNQLAAFFDTDVTSLTCESALSCGGKSMVNVNDRLSGTLFSTPSSDPTSTARYMTLALRSNGSSHTYSYISFGIRVSQVSWYTAWRSSRPWAGGSTNNSETGIGDASSDPNASLALCESNENYLSTVNVDGSIIINVSFEGQLFKMGLALSETENGNYIFDVTGLDTLNCRLN